MSRPNSSASQNENSGDNYNEDSQDIDEPRPRPGHGRAQNWPMRLVTQEMENHDHDYQLPSGRERMGDANGIEDIPEEGAVGGVAPDGMRRIAAPHSPNQVGAVGGMHYTLQPRLARNFSFARQALLCLAGHPSMAEGPPNPPPGGIPHRWQGIAHYEQLEIAAQDGHPPANATFGLGELAVMFRSSPRQSSATGEMTVMPGSSTTAGTSVRSPPSTSGVRALMVRSESPPSTSAAAAMANTTNTTSTATADADTPVRATRTQRTPKGKRKRLSLEPSQAGGTPKAAEDDQEDGLICPICLDVWEMSGEHRLVSLKCGHLFGENCIRRWLNECSRQGGQKSCPQCKSRAKSSEIRHLYAKRLRALDRTEEHELKRQLEDEKRLKTDLAAEVSRLKMTLSMYTTRVDALQFENDRMKQTISGLSASREPTVASAQSSEIPLLRLSLERNVELSPEPGSRVMVFSKVHASLLVSQKSGLQGLFPGYGLRVLETKSFRPITFIHTSGKYLRDLSLSHDEALVAVASMEPRVKLFDVRTHAFNAVIMPNDKAIWSCAFGRNDRDNTIFVGAQHGSTFLYDTRFPDNVLEEYQNTADISPIINIAPIAAGPLYPNGGFLVCKMQSLWFYEFLSAGYDTKATRLGAEGPFVSMNYDAVHHNIVLFTRTNSRNPTSRYIFGKLDKVMGTPTFTEISVFFGSKSVPVMTRCSQILVNKNVLIATYIQDEKKLTLFDTGREIRTQSVPIESVVYDNCPVSNAEGNFLAALTETKLRIYKLTNHGVKS